MTTLSDQINSDFWTNVAKYKEQHYQWMLTHKDLATHAVTLTFDPTKIQSFLEKKNGNEVKQSIFVKDVQERNEVLWASFE